jgi:hypothetical protein
MKKPVVLDLASRDLQTPVLDILRGPRDRGALLTQLQRRRDRGRCRDHEQGHPKRHRRLVIGVPCQVSHCIPESGGRRQARHPRTRRRDPHLWVTVLGPTSR